jgi:trigger factor
MSVNIEELSPVKKKISFDIPWPDVQKELENTYRTVAKTARIKGFRQGKIPRNIIELHYKDHVEGEVAANLVNQFYWDALKEYDIHAVTQPQIDQKGIEKEKNFAFTAVVEVEPLVDPIGYIDLELEKEELDITESDVEARLGEIREMFATMQDMEEDRGLKEGDFATIDFQGMLNGEPQKDMKADDYFLEIGSKMLVPGFEDQLIGMKKGESKEAPVTFPDDYHAEHLKGKDVLFSVTLKGIKEKKLPEINEAFVRNFEKYETLEDLKAEVRNNLESENKARIGANLGKLIVDKLLENKDNEFEVPPSFVERQIFQMMAETQRRLLSRGMDKKAATEMTVKMHDAYKDDARKIVRTALIIKNIARKENITVSDEELQERIRLIADSRGQTPEAVREALEKDDMLDHVANEALHNKVFDFIEAKARITMMKKDRSPAGEEKS